MDPSQAPSMQANAVRLLPSSTTAMFIGTPISSALARAPSTTFCAAPSVMLLATAPPLFPDSDPRGPTSPYRGDPLGTSSLDAVPPWYRMHRPMGPERPCTWTQRTRGRLQDRSTSSASRLGAERSLLQSPVPTLCAMAN